jgi:hypothetical protein
MNFIYNYAVNQQMPSDKIGFITYQYAPTGVGRSCGHHQDALQEY